MSGCDLFIGFVIVAVLAGIIAGNEIICRGLAAESVRQEAMGLVILVLSVVLAVVVMVFILTGRLRTLCAF